MCGFRLLLVPGCLFLCIVDFYEFLERLLEPSEEQKRFIQRDRADTKERSPSANHLRGPLGMTEGLRTSVLRSFLWSHIDSKPDHFVQIEEPSERNLRFPFICNRGFPRSCLQLLLRSSKTDPRVWSSGPVLLDFSLTVTLRASLAMQRWAQVVNNAGGKTEGGEKLLFFHPANFKLEKPAE